MIVDYLVAAAESNGGRVAVSDVRLTLTYRRLQLAARAIRRVAIRETENHRVGIMLPASSTFSACFFGMLWAEKQVVPLNFLLSGDELSAIVTAARLDVVFTVRHFADLARQLPARVVFLEDLPLKRLLLAEMFRRAPGIPQVDGNDTAVVMFTSGTAAAPKGVELTFLNLVSNAEDSIASVGLTSGHRFLNCLPPFHAFGLTANVLIPVVLQATVHSIFKFSATEVADAVRKHGISVFLAIPSMFNAILNAKSVPDDLFRDIYLLLSGAEPLSDVTVREFHSRFGVHLVQGYGLTETSPVCTINAPENVRRGTVGQAIRQVTIRIVDSDGNDLRAGREGEVWIKGPNIMKGYLDDPEETARVVGSDGWLRTGDYGHLDQEGFLTISGRLKELMIIGGENVAPREIESIMEQHPAVVEVAVVAISDRIRGEAAVAFVVLHESRQVTEIELREFVRHHLAPFKVPRRVIIRAELPRSPTGKVLKRELVKLL